MNVILDRSFTSNNKNINMIVNPAFIINLMRGYVIMEEYYFKIYLRSSHSVFKVPAGSVPGKIPGPADPNCIT